MANSAAQLAGRIRKTADALNQSKRVGVSAVALLTKESVLGAARSSGVGPALRGVGAKGAKWNVRYDVKGGVNATALVKAVGPAHLVNNPTKPHEIRLRKRRGKRALTVGDGFAAVVNRHPGTKGKGFWQKGVAVARPRAKDVYQRALRRALASNFTGR